MASGQSVGNYIEPTNVLQIVKRETKGSPLTYDELDKNYKLLEASLKLSYPMVAYDAYLAAIKLYEANLAVVTSIPVMADLNLDRTTFLNGGNIDAFKFYIYKVDAGSTFPITPMGYNSQYEPRVDFYLFDNDLNLITNNFDSNFSTGEIIIWDEAAVSNIITIQQPGYIICRRSTYESAS